MLFRTPKAGSPLNWKVINQADGSSDLIPFVATEGPTGGSRSTIRGIAHRTSKDGKTKYYDVINAPERFVSFRDEVLDALEGTADSPLTLGDLMQLVLDQEEQRESQRAAAAEIAS